MPLTPQEEFELLSLKRKRFQQPQTNSLTETLSSSAPVKPSGDPVIDALIGMQKEFVGPLAKGANVAAFGIPKLLTQAIGGQEFAQQAFPAQSTFGGKLLNIGAQGAGYLGGGAAKLSTGIGERVFPKIVVESMAKGIPSSVTQTGLNLSKGAMTKGHNAILANKMMRGALEGAIYGGVQLDPMGTGEVSVGGQLGQATSGAVLGASIPLAWTGLKQAGRGFKKFRTPTKTDSYKHLIPTAKKQAEGFRQTLKQESDLALQNIDESIRGLRNDGKNAAQSMVDSLEIAFKIENEELALKLQSKLPEIYRTNSKSYGNKLDTIFDKLSKNGDDVIGKDVHVVYNDIIRDMDEAGIVGGKARQAVENFGEKYGLIINQTPEGVISNANQRITVKDIYNELKNIRNSLSSGAKSGTTRYSQEDLAVSIFNHRIGDLLEEKAPELIELRRQYAPILNVMKKSNTIFKPFKGEYGLQQGAEFLERTSLGKTKYGEERLLSALEQGSDFAPGIGTLTEGLVKRGNELKLARQRLAPLLTEISDNNLIFKEGIDKEFATKLQTLLRKREFALADSLGKEKMIESVLEKRLEGLGIRKDMINNLRTNKAKMLNLTRTVLFIGGGIAGGYMAIKRLLQGK